MAFFEIASVLCFIGILLVIVLAVTFGIRQRINIQGQYGGSRFSFSWDPQSTSTSTSTSEIDGKLLFCVQSPKYCMVLALI